MRLNAVVAVVAALALTVSAIAGPLSRSDDPNCARTAAPLGACESDGLIDVSTRDDGSSEIRANLQRDTPQGQYRLRYTVLPRPNVLDLHHLADLRAVEMSADTASIRVCAADSDNLEQQLVAASVVVVDVDALQTSGVRSNMDAPKAELFLRLEEVTRDQDGCVSAAVTHHDHTVVFKELEYQWELDTSVKAARAEQGWEQSYEALELLYNAQSQQVNGQTVYSAANSRLALSDYVKSKTGKAGPLVGSCTNTFWGGEYSLYSNVRISYDAFSKDVLEYDSGVRLTSTLNYDCHFGFKTNHRGRTIIRDSPLSDIFTTEVTGFQLGPRTVDVFISYQMFTNAAYTGKTFADSGPIKVESNVVSSVRYHTPTSSFVPEVEGSSTITHPQADDTWVYAGNLRAAFIADFNLTFNNDVVANPRVIQEFSYNFDKRSARNSGLPIFQWTSQVYSKPSPNPDGELQPQLEPGKRTSVPECASQSIQHYIGGGGRLHNTRQIPHNGGYWDNQDAGVTKLEGTTTPNCCTNCQVGECQNFHIEVNEYCDSGPCCYPDCSFVLPKGHQCFGATRAPPQAGYCNGFDQDCHLPDNNAADGCPLDCNDKGVCKDDNTCDCVDGFGGFACLRAPAELTVEEGGIFTVGTDAAGVEEGVVDAQVVVVRQERAMEAPVLVLTSGNATIVNGYFKSDPYDYMDDFAEQNSQAVVATVMAEEEAGVYMATVITYGQGRVQAKVEAADSFPPQDEGVDVVMVGAGAGAAAAVLVAAVVGVRKMRSSSSSSASITI